MNDLLSSAKVSSTAVSPRLAVTSLRSYRLSVSDSILRIAPLSSETSSLSPAIPFLLIDAVIILSSISAVFSISSPIVISTDSAIL